MRKIVSFIIIFVLVSSSVALTKNIYSSYKKLHGLSEVGKQEQSLHNQTEVLKKELKKRESGGFVEQQARDTLGLAKKGETIYVVDGGSGNDASSSQQYARNLSNWQLWLRVFTQ